MVAFYAGENGILIEGIEQHKQVMENQLAEVILVGNLEGVLYLLPFGRIHLADFGQISDSRLLHLV